MPAQLLRQMQPEEVVCPAGELVGDCDVRCRIVSETMQGQLNPVQVEGHCAGNYTTCNIWREHRDAEHKHTDRALREQLAREEHGD